MSGSVVLLGLTVIAYLLAANLLAANLLLRRPELVTGGRATTLLGALCHFAAIGFRCVELQRAPFTTPAESLSLLAWLLSLFYLVADLRWRLTAAGPFALGLSFLLVILGATLPKDTPGGLTGQHTEEMASNAISSELLSSHMVSFHILATVGAVGIFALAFSCAALYLVVHHLLKSKHGLTWMNRLPALRTVESAAFTLVAVGFPLLTLGILSGYVRALGGGLGTGWATDPKALLSYAVWAVYGVYLLARLLWNWPSVRTAYVLLIGLVFCILLFVAPTTAHRFE